MAFFAIIARNDVQIAERIKAMYPDDHFRTWDGLWFVSDNVTTQQVAEKLSISSGDIGSAVVLSVNNYWGRAPKSLWEWLSRKEK